MAIQSKVHRYKPAELNLDELAEKAQEVLNKRPFFWQLEVAEAILCGEDVIVDVGTGSGKTLTFTLPLLAAEQEDDIVLTVSPLTALMIDQANTAELPTVAVCAETIAKVGIDQLYKDVVSAKFRQVLVSPEVATSSSSARSLFCINSSLIREALLLEILNVYGTENPRIFGGQTGLFRGSGVDYGECECVLVISATFP